MGWLASLSAACLVLVGFFTPWMNGSSVFDLRSFSGFDFARLVRNFEITANSAEASGQIRATAVAIMAFGAIGLSDDATGEFCRSLFQVVLISLSLSWVTAMTVTPVVCVMFLKAPKTSR